MRNNPDFQKRHFEFIAETLQEVVRLAETSEATAKETADFVVERFGDALRTTNPGFKRSRFISACVPGANVRART